MRNFLIFLLTIQLVRCLNSEDNNSVLFRNNNVDIDEGVANGGMGGAGGDGGDAINTTGKAGNGGRGGVGGSGGEAFVGGNGGGNGKGGNGRAVWWSSSPSPKGSRTNQPAYKPAKYGAKSTQHPHPSQPSQPPKKPNDKPNKRPKPGKHQEEPPTGVPRDCLEGIPDDPPAQLQCELDALAERDQLDTKPTYPWLSTKKPGLIAVMKPGKIPNDHKPKNPTPTPTQTPTPSAKPSKGKDKGKGKGNTAAHSTTVTSHSTTGRPSTSDSFDEILEILNRPQLKPAKPQKKPNEKPKDKPQDQSHDKPHDRPQEKPQEIHQNKPQVDGQDSLPGLKPSIDRPWLKPAVKPLPHTDLESPMRPVFKPMKPHIPFLWPRPREELEEPSEDENTVETSVEDKVSEGVVLEVEPFFA